MSFLSQTVLGSLAAIGFLDVLQGTRRLIHRHVCRVCKRRR